MDVEIHGNVDHAFRIPVSPDLARRSFGFGHRWPKDPGDFRLVHPHQFRGIRFLGAAFLLLLVRLAAGFRIGLRIGLVRPIPAP